MKLSIIVCNHLVQGSKYVKSHKFNVGMLTIDTYTYWAESSDFVEPVLCFRVLKAHFAYLFIT